MVRLRLCSHNEKFDPGPPKLFSHQEVSNYINKAMALHVAIRRLRNNYIAAYQHSMVIKSSPGFGGGIPIDITLIVRQGHGVIGFRCIGGYDAGQPFETRLVKALPYEMKMIEAGANELPPHSRQERVNTLLRHVPSRLAIRLQSFIKQLISNR